MQRETVETLQAGCGAVGCSPVCSWGKCGARAVEPSQQAGSEHALRAWSQSCRPQEEERLDLEAMQTEPKSGAMGGA